jgi:signal transduction histidine kinase
MTDPTGIPLVAAGAYFVAVLVWASLFAISGRLLLTRHPHGTVRLATLLMGVVTCYYGLGLGSLLLAAGVSPRWLSLLRNLCVIGAVALLRHVVPLSAVREETPAPAWVAVNYAFAGLAAVLVIVAGTVPGAPTPGVVLLLYVPPMLAVTLRRAWLLAGRGAWRPGGIGELRSADAIVFGGGALALAALGSLLWVGGGTAQTSPGTVVMEGGLGLILAIPFLVRLLVETTRALLVTVSCLGATAAAYFGVRAAVPPGGAARDLATVLALFLVLVPGQAWLRRGVDRIVFGHRRRLQVELLAFLHRLSPELGVAECCRRALDEVVRLMQIRGAAVVFREGEAVASGRIEVAKLAAVWPRGAAAADLPSRAFGGPDFRILPVAMREAMIEAEIVGVVPIVSPRQRWGDLVATAGMMTAIYSDEDVQAAEAFAAQLALVLDAAELIARAVAVERSLAHAEKLSAIGELTARIAHEIRNPVTAARSLAQQLAAEGASPFAAEHALILAELERVERQVAALLRFARREEFRFEAVDVGALVRATAEQFRPRLEAAGIAVEFRLTEGVTARGDREKLRQVLINLIENAVDALGEKPEGRRLELAAGAADGAAALRIADNGPGVAPDVLPHIFEPFFSSKEKGTGLGLAIARRTIEAHGGRIAVASEAGTGLRVDVQLPLAAGGTST